MQNFRFADGGFGGQALYNNGDTVLAYKTQDTGKINTYYFTGPNCDGTGWIMFDVNVPKTRWAERFAMLGYSDDKGFVFHLNAQKNYVSLYVGDAKKVDPDGALLSGINVGKGCIRFSKTTPISEAGIGEFVRRAIGMWKRGEDVGC